MVNSISPRCIHVVVVKCTLCKEIKSVDRAYHFHFDAQKRLAELESTPEQNQNVAIEAVLLYD